MCLETIPVLSKSCFFKWGSRKNGLFNYPKANAKISRYRYRLSSKFGILGTSQADFHTVVKAVK